jgi:hypothetical protein
LELYRLNEKAQHFGREFKCDHLKNSPDIKIHRCQMLRKARYSAPMKQSIDFQDYHYSERSRRPIVFVIGAISLVMVMIAYHYNAEWYFFIPLGLSLAMSLWSIIVDRLSGMDLAGTSITMFAGNWKNTIDIADIAAVKITRWTDGAPTVVLKLKNGKSETVPGYCLGSSKEFSDALAERGVPVTVN